MKNFKNLFTSFIGFSRIKKQIILLVSDFLILDLALYISFVLRLETLHPANYIYQDWWLFIFLPIIFVLRKILSLAELFSSIIIITKFFFEYSLKILPISNSNKLSL